MIKNIAINKSFSSLLILMGMFSIIYFSVISTYISNHIDSAYISWQDRISTISEVKMDNLKKWFREKDNTLKAISENITVQLYLTEYGNKNIKETNDDKFVQQQFLTSYLSSEAQKSGFINSLNNFANIKANVKKHSNAALTLLNKEGKIILSKDLKENLNNIIQKNIKNITTKTPYKTIIYLNDSNYYISSLPIRMIQSNEIGGYIVGIKKIGAMLQNILNFPPESYATSSTSLLVKNNNSIKFVVTNSNNQNDKVINFSEKGNSAKVAAVKEPNKILVKNDGKTKSIIIAKQINDKNWFLTYEISQLEAMKDAFLVRKSIIYTSIFLFIAIILAIFLAWRHSSSIKYQKLSKIYEEQNKLLKLVTENQIQKMFILDSKNIIRFVNGNFAKLFNMKVEELHKKTFKSIVGPALSDEYTAISSRIEGRKKPVIITKKTKENNQDRYIQRKFIPISEVPSDDNSVTNGTLVVENDISNVVEERIKKEKNLDETIKILIKIVEERSIYYHNHSENVSKLSKQLALNLNLEEKEIKALEIASRLSNLYLVLMPSEILNKKGKPTREEQKIFDSCPAKTIELIKQIDFDAPVLTAIEQQYERPDGKGKLKLKDEDIAKTAKILKAANDYVAMTSPRAYRKSLSAKKAVDEMLKAKGKKYSENIVYALANIVTK